MSDSQDVQAAVDRLAAALELSVLVEDRRQKPVWWSTQGSVDQTRTSSILNRHVERSAAAVIRQYGLDRAEQPVRTPAMPERGMWARWCVPARHDGRVVGYLWVLDPENTVGEHRLPLLVECAELAAEVLATSATADVERRRRRDALIDLLLGRRDSEAAAELARLEQLPHDVLVQVEAPARSGGWALPGSMSAHPVRRRPRPATSGEPLPLTDLKLAAERARATVRAVAAGARLSTVSWDALGAWHLVVSAPSSLPVNRVHPAADVLRAQQRDELLITARTVLDLGGDVASAAGALHVHRTTLYYRIDRIQDLTGVDLRRPEPGTHLQLALWLDAYRRTPEDL